MPPASAAKPPRRRWGLPLLTAAVAVALLGANGVPPRPAVLEWSLWFVAGSVFAALARRLEWGYLLAVALLAGVNAVSVTKQQLMGAPLWAQDLTSALAAPEVLLGFIRPLAWLATALALLGLAWAWRRSRRLRWRPWTVVLALAAAANIGVQFSDVDGLWLPERRWPSYASASLLTLSGVHPRTLTEPATQAHGLCCASAPASDLLLRTDTPQTQRPHIVAVLLESTFDLRRITGLAATPDPWRDWQPLPIRVFTTGGATWVQEYALLHGVDPTAYGPHFRFIHHLAGTQLKGRLAPSLATLGYESSSVLAYDKAFYGSERFHQVLGVDTVLGCAQVPGCEGAAPPQRDDAVLRTIGARLAETTTPQFVFALTLTNHSPHNPGTAPRDPHCDARHAPALCGVLADYAQRQAHIQTQMRQWVQALHRTVQRPVLVTFFGDHIPADVEALSTPADFAGSDNTQTVAFTFDTRTDRPLALLPADWHCQHTPAFSVADLDALMLRQAGYASPYVQAKLERLRAQSQC